MESDPPIPPYQRGSQMPLKSCTFPLLLKGLVIHGFGRGSKELGIPTANLPIERYAEELEKYPVGVYYAWGCVPSVDKGAVHKVAMSIGLNPFYNNTTKTIEAHILHTYDSDFYDEEMRLVVLGYIRPEWNFKSKEELIAAIEADIAYSKEVLDQEENLKFKDNPFLRGAVTT